LQAESRVSGQGKRFFLERGWKIQKRGMIVKKIGRKEGNEKVEEGCLARSAIKKTIPL
jgi:hypothetical protein